MSGGQGEHDCAAPPGTRPQAESNVTSPIGFRMFGAESPVCEARERTKELPARYLPTLNPPSRYGRTSQPWMRNSGGPVPTSTMLNPLSMNPFSSMLMISGS